MKTKLASIILSAVFIVANVALPLLPIFSPRADAAPAKHQEVPIGQNLLCYASLHPSTYVASIMDQYGLDQDRQAGVRLAEAAKISSGDAQNTYQKASDNTPFVTITFDSDETNYQSTCRSLGVMMQSQTDTFTFYGITGSGFTTFSGSVSTDKHLTIASLPPLNSSITFTDIDGYNASYFSVPGGGAGGNTICPQGKFSLAGAGGKDGNLQTQACVNQYASTARFVDATTINFAGAQFKADSWTGNTGNHPQNDSMRYVLSRAPANDPEWTKSGKLSYIDIDTSKSISATFGSAIDLNISGGDPTSFANNITFARTNPNNQVTAYFANWNKQNQDSDQPYNVNPASNNAPISFKTTLSGISTFGRYYPGTDKRPATIQPIFASGGGNEMAYIGNYAKTDPTHADRFISDGGPSGCNNASAKPYFDGIPANADKLPKGSLISVPWQLNTGTNCGSFHQASIKLYVMDPADTPEEINQTGVKCVSDDPNNAAATAPVNSDGSCPDGFHVEGGSGKQTCEQSAGGLGWIMCVIIDALADAVNGIYTKIIVPMMQIPALTASDTKSATDPVSGADKLKVAWSSFRVFGNIILVVVVLIIVFGEAIGGGMLDAYTIKKVLPRLLIAAIGINLSYYIVGGFIDITNIIGNGIRLMITAPFGLNGNDFDFKTINGATEGGFLGLSSAGVAALIAAADGAALAGAFIWIIFTLLPMLFFLFIAIMGVLALRLGLIYAAVLLSPVAFALWVLPNTEQYFKKWWELLQSTALVYPIVSALFGISMVLAQTTVWITGSKGAINGVIGYIISLIIVIMPLVLIPFAFKLAGGILSRAYDLASNASKQGTGWMKKRGEMRKQRMLDGTFLNPNKLGNTERGAKFNKALQRNATRSLNEHDEARGSRFGRPGSGSRNEIIDDAIMARKSAHRAEYAKRMEDLYAGDEHKVRAAMEAYDSKGNFSERMFRDNLQAHNTKALAKGEAAPYTAADIDQALIKVKRTRAQMGDTAFTIASSTAMMKNGTVDKDDNEKVMKWIDRATHGDKQAGINFMLAAAEEAKAAGRVDLFSSSPSDNIKAYLHETGQQKSADIDAAGGTTEWLLRKAKETRAPGELAMMKGHGIERMAPLYLEDMEQQQAVVMGTTEYRQERQAKQQLVATGNAVQSEQANLQQVELKVQDLQARATRSGAAGNSQLQQALTTALNERVAAQQAVASASENYSISVSQHKAAQKDLENSDSHKKLMITSARAQSIIDLSAQIPEGKVTGYVKDLFSHEIDTVNDQGNVEKVSVASYINNPDTVTNETYRLYHREWGDAQSQRIAGYQAQAAAMSGRPGGIPPVGPPGSS